MTHIAPNPDSFEYEPKDFFSPLPLDELFTRPAPLEVDVGCGEGAFLVALAKKTPQHNFIGIERLVGRVRKVCRRATRARLGNMRVMCVESLYTVGYLLPRGSVSVMHVMFADPWPKRRHWVRRMINREFLDAAHGALRADGELRLTTDDAPYFAHMQTVTAAHEGFAAVPWPDDPDYPQTDFEKRFRALGLPIHRLLLKKV